MVFPDQFFKKRELLKNFIYLFLAVLALHCYRGLSLVAESRGCSLVTVCGLFHAVASLVVQSRLQGIWALAGTHRGSIVEAPWFQSTGSIATANGLSCSTACGIFPDLGPNPCLLHWQADSLPPGHPGSPKKKMYLM